MRGVTGAAKEAPQGARSAQRTTPVRERSRTPGGRVARNEAPAPAGGGGPGRHSEESLTGRVGRSAAVVLARPAEGPPGPQEREEQGACDHTSNDPENSRPTRREVA